MAPPKARGLSWEQASPAPMVLVRGSEDLLAARAIDRIIDQVLRTEPSTDITRFEAAAYQGGELSYLTSPSLFGEPRLIVVEHAEAMTDAFLNDTVSYLKSPADDVVMIIRHHSGQRGKKLLDAISRAGFPTITCDVVKRDQDKADLVRADVRAAGRRIDHKAVTDLVDAVGTDLRELASATAQLLADVDGEITSDHVRTYHAGRMEVTSFAVADAAIAGRAGQAVTLLRHALATKVSPVALTVALSMKLRQLAKVSVARGRSQAELGMAPWQADRARRELSGWTPTTLADAIEAVADADAHIKGLGRDENYAIERAVLTVAQCRARGSAPGGGGQ